MTASYTCKNGVDDALIPTGVGYCYSDKNHPEWFLTDPAGKRIESCAWSSRWLMDVGNASYQQTWLDNVAAEAKARGFDGVMLDDVNQSQTGHLCGRTICKYPQAADFTAAMSSFMAKVGPGLSDKGLLVMPNIFIANWWEPSGIAAWDALISNSSGAVQEYFTKWGMDSGQWFTDDGGYHNDWTYRQDFLRRTQAAGKIFVGLTYAPSTDLQLDAVCAGELPRRLERRPECALLRADDARAAGPVQLDLDEGPRLPAWSEVQGRARLATRLQRRCSRRQPVPPPSRR